MDTKHKKNGFTPLEKKKKSLTGFTLLEIVLVICVVGILAGMLAPLISATIDSWTYAAQRKDAVSEARVAMFRIAREIRQIKDSSSITTASSDTFEFQDVNNVTIRFEQIGTDLKRNSSVLAANLKVSGGLSFAYLDGNGNTTANLIDIRTVIITITLENASGALSLQDAVCPRNLG